MNLESESNWTEKKWIPDGFHFLGPEESLRRHQSLDKITQIFIKNKFSLVTLPAFDYSSSFWNQISPEERDSILKIRDAEGMELSPGIDLTLQAVKGMAARSHWSENQNIFYFGRRIRDQKKRNATRREVLQVGAECLGDSSSPRILFLVRLLQEIFNSLSIKQPIAFVLGHAGLFPKDSSLFKSNPEALIARNLVYTKNTPELDGLNQKANPLDIQSSVPLLLETHTFSDFSNYKDKWRTSALDERTKQLGIKILDEIHLFCKGFLPAFPTFSGIWDPGLLRDLTYYTGYVFQGYYPGNSEPLFSGGVYNDLYESYSGVPKEACGFAINFDLIEQILTKEEP